MQIGIAEVFGAVFDASRSRSKLPPLSRFFPEIAPGVLLYLLMSFAAPSLHAEVLPDSPGKWTFNAIDFFEGDRLSGFGWDQKDVATLRGQMRSMVETIRDEEAHPMGVDRRLSGRVEFAYHPRFARVKDKPYLPVSGYFILNAFEHYSRRDGGVDVSGEGPTIMIYLNGPIGLGDRFPIVEALDDADPAEAGVYLEPEKKGEVQGFPIYNGLIVMTRSQKPLWVPVSRERVLRAMIREAEQSEAEEQKVIAKAPPQQRERMLQYRSEMREGLARKGPARLWVLPGERARMLKEELESLGAKGDEDAYVNRQECLVPERKTASCLVEAGTTGATRLVIPNPDFYDRTLPKSAIQRIAIRDYFAYKKEVERELSRNRSPNFAKKKQVEFIESIDWKKFATAFVYE